MRDGTKNKLTEGYIIPIIWTAVGKNSNNIFLLVYNCCWLQHCFQLFMGKYLPLFTCSHSSETNRFFVSHIQCSVDVFWHIFIFFRHSYSLIHIKWIMLSKVNINYYLFLSLVAHWKRVSKVMVKIRIYVSKVFCNYVVIYYWIKSLMMCKKMFLVLANQNANPPVPVVSWFSR